MASTVLYAAVTLRSGDQCTTTLGMLRRQPAIARHVRELIIRLKNKTGKGLKPRYFDSIIASTAVRDIAESKVLDALSTFAWDDDELPGDDNMWYSLRVQYVLWLKLFVILLNYPAMQLSSTPLHQYRLWRTILASDKSCKSPSFSVSADRGR